jgi:inositol-phosphate transport system permease protein
MPDFARAQLNRQRANFVLFLGPALMLLVCFFVAPVVVDVVLAFTDMDRTLSVTAFTLENFERMATRDSRLLASLGITAVFVLSTLAIFNVTFALLLALMTTAVSQKAGAFFRAVWLLPRMSPSVVYALLWAWVVDPNERGLLNQILIHVFGVAPVDPLDTGCREVAVDRRADGGEEPVVADAVEEPVAA